MKNKENSRKEIFHFDTYCSVFGAGIGIDILGFGVRVDFSFLSPGQRTRYTLSSKQGKKYRFYLVFSPSLKSGFAINQISNPHDSSQKWQACFAILGFEISTINEPWRGI
jgi:hypothetical protein